MGTFKKGLMLGGILGAGLMWLNATTKGRAMRDELLKHAERVFEEVKKSKQWEKLTKNQYVKAVEDAVNRYAVENDLSDSVRDMVEKLVKSQWKNAKKK